MTEFISFDDVLAELMLEEEHPTQEALVRWQERYPQYREALASFFETWAGQEALSDLPQAHIDEEKIVRKGVDYALDILQKQGRLISPESIGSLGEYDQLVLTTVYLLHGKGHPATITAKVGQLTGKRALLGSIFVSLERLEMKGLVSSRYADPAIEPEADTRRYFTVTLSGERALAHARETSAVVARFLPDFA